VQRKLHRSPAAQAARRRLRIERQRAVVYGLAFGLVAAAIGSIALHPSGESPGFERVAAIAAMVAPVLIYAAWLASSRRRQRFLRASADAADEAERAVPAPDVATVVQARLDEHRTASNPFVLGTGRDREVSPDARAELRATIRKPDPEVVRTWSRANGPASGSTRPA
jgi:hypothetical protein